MRRGLLSQAVAEETSGVERAENGDQTLYNVFVKAGYAIIKKTKDGIAQRLQAGDPINGLAQVTVQVVEKAIQELAKMGAQVTDDVIREGGKELMELIHRDYKLNMNEDEAEKAMAVAIDSYLSNRERDGTLDTSGMGDMVQQIQQGTLPSGAGEAA